MQEQLFLFHFLSQLSHLNACLLHIRSSTSVTYKKGSCFALLSRYALNEFLSKNSCTIHSFFMVCNILIIFGRKNKGQFACRMPERQL